MVAQKADFTDIYTRPDPRAYYRTLRELEYGIPEYGRGVFDVVLDELRSGKESPMVLDVCCSYGVNAALLNHAVTLDEIGEHYAGAEGLSRHELLELDREWYSSRRSPAPVEVVGMDVSQPAIDYAVEAGLLADGVVADLERDLLSAGDAARISGVDLVTVTGGVGYVNDRTFDKILSVTDGPPWVAALTLRWIGFDSIAETLDAHGLVTEKLDGFVVPQRRFADAGEEQFVIDQLAAQGMEPTDVERNGHHGAELYLARPAAHAAGLSLNELFESVSTESGSAQASVASSLSN
jgi:SAM-dependent methyltransferase